MRKATHSAAFAPDSLIYIKSYMGSHPLSGSPRPLQNPQMWMQFKA
ncbi:hypothetical protein HMPREF9371_1144 [Neisseria shayeganii 871]|uniref:Uncharacterized protein n=1 Tax=Neisseria shayeganii 871 TaxID=1032488 RepID=G4CHQ5_9NEIS|nr:hypothetical protein HMPREF9371_1144 [Neisseria shayeganii 871]